MTAKSAPRLGFAITASRHSIPGASTRKTSDDALLMRVTRCLLRTPRAGTLVSLSAPKPARAVDTDPVIAAFENAPEEPMTDEEHAAFEEAVADPRAGVSADEVLERLRPKP
jgi:hypothetical protein